VLIYKVFRHRYKNKIINKPKNKTKKSQSTIRVDFHSRLKLIEDHDKVPLPQDFKVITLANRWECSKKPFA